MRREARERENNGGRGWVYLVSQQKSLRFSRPIRNR